MSLVDTINSAAAAAAAIALKAFPDKCSIKEPGPSVADGFGGTIETETTVERDIPCLYEPLTKSMAMIAGSSITSQTHRLTVKATENTRLIKPHQTIVVDERLLPELTFENPVTLDGSFAPLVMVAAELSK